VSDSQQDSRTATAGPTPPNDSALNQAVDWCAKHWARVRLGHEGVMLDEVQRNMRRREAIAYAAAQGDTSQLKGWPDQDEGDDMGVNIGDNTTHNHYYPQAQPAGDQGLSLGGVARAVAPWLIAAAIGLPGGYGLAKWFEPAPVTTPQPAAGYEYDGRAYVPAEPDEPLEEPVP